MKMKRLIAAALSLCMLGGAVTWNAPAFLEGGITASAEDVYSGKCGDYLTWSLDEEGGTLTISGLGNMDNYAYSIQSGNVAPWRELDYRQVVVEEGVTVIGKYAFCHSDIQSITLPETLVKIADAAFMWTTLKTIVLPDSLTTLGNAVFCNSNLQTVNIPPKVEEIPWDCFAHSEIAAITIPENVTKLGKHAFSCGYLGAITILNPTCDIYDDTAEQGTTITNMLYAGKTYESGKYYGVIYGTEGSTAQSYANKYGYTFKTIDEISKIPGDLNDDGTLSISDVVILQKWLLAVPNTYMIRWQNADLYEDERLDVFDLCLMKRLLMSFRIEEQPVRGKISKDGEYTMSVRTEGGTEPYSYQWYKSTSRTRFSEIEGATSSTYTATEQMREYYCVITDADGNKLISDHAYVEPYYPLEIFGQSLDGQIKDYKGYDLLVGVQGGNEPYSYQWYKDREAIDEEEAKCHEYYAHEPGVYFCKVTDADGTEVISDDINVTEYEKLYLLNEQSDITLTEDGYMLPMQPRGGGGGYLWYYLEKDGENIYIYGPSENRNLGYKLTEPGSYRFTVLECASFAEINSLLNPELDRVLSNRFTVYPQITFTQQPTGGEIKVGESIDLSVAVSGGKEPYTYQWQLDDEDIIGATESTYTATAPGKYCCFVSDSAGNEFSIRSNYAEVIGDLQIIEQPEDIMLESYYSTEKLDITANGGKGDITYTWQKWNNDTNKWVNFTTTSSISYISVTGADAGRFRCAVQDTGTGMLLYSDPVYVSVKMNITYMEEGDKLIFFVTGGCAPYEVSVQLYSRYFNWNGVVDNTSGWNDMGQNLSEAQETTEGIDVIIPDKNASLNLKTTNGYDYGYSNQGKWRVIVTDVYGQSVQLEVKV